MNKGTLVYSTKNIPEHHKGHNIVVSNGIKNPLRKGAWGESIGNRRSNRREEEKRPVSICSKAISILNLSNKLFDIGWGIAVNCNRRALEAHENYMKKLKAVN